MNILFALLFSVTAPAATAKGECPHWDVHGRQIVAKAKRFDELIERLQTSTNPDADLAKFAAKEGLPFTSPLFAGQRLPGNRLERREEKKPDEFATGSPSKEPVSVGEYVVFSRILPSTESDSLFYEFTGRSATKPLRRWRAPGHQSLPGDVQGDEMIFKLPLQSLCGSKNFWNAGIAVKPDGKFRVVPYKNDQYPSIVSGCSASRAVFRDSPFSTCGEVRDSKKSKRLLVYKLTKE